MQHNKIKDVDTNESGDMLNDPSFLAQIQNLQLAKPNSAATEHLIDLPPSVLARINALKHLQCEYFKLESNYYEEMSHLEFNFHEKVASFLEKRKAFINGDIEPNEKESRWDDDDDREEVVKESVKTEEDTTTTKNDHGDVPEDEVMKGIPKFWLMALKNVDHLNSMITEIDEEILEYLEDVVCTMHTAPPARSGFRLDFHFKTNPFFHNEVLQKEYFIRFEPLEKDPLSYEGPEIVETRGCNIDWKQGKNVTIKIVKKNTKSKKGKHHHQQHKTISQTVKADSFFNFFNPPLKNIDEIVDDSNNEDEEEEMLLHSDFEIGQLLRERLIPRAIMYYTGDAVECDMDDDDEEEDDDDDGNESSSESVDNSKKGKLKQQQDCKQQ